MCSFIYEKYFFVLKRRKNKVTHLYLTFDTKFFFYFLTRNKASEILSNIVVGNKITIDGVINKFYGSYHKCGNILLLSKY